MQCNHLAQRTDAVEDRAASPGILSSKPMELSVSAPGESPGSMLEKKDDAPDPSRMFAA